MTGYVRQSYPVKALFFDGTNHEAVRLFAGKAFKGTDWLTGGVYVDLMNLKSRRVTPRTWLVRNWEGDIEAYGETGFAREFTKA